MKKQKTTNWPKPGQPKICPLCGREIPTSQREEHHLVPKLKGGKKTVAMHRICHRTIHALFSESELATRYNSVEALLEHSSVQNFVKWIITKPVNFSDSAKQSNRTRKKS